MNHYGSDWSDKLIDTTFESIHTVVPPAPEILLNINLCNFQKSLHTTICGCTAVCSNGEGQPSAKFDSNETDEDFDK